MTLPSPIVSGLIRAIPLAFALSSMAAGAGLAQTRAELRWGVGMEIASLDPVYQTNNWEYVATANIYDGLVWPDEKKGVAPWIADSWTISDDGKTYVFTLKTNVPFHDGGLLTAEDVAFSMKRMLDLAGPAASNFRSVDPDGIRVIDAKTVSFSLKEPNSAFLKALLTFKIVSKKIVLANKAEGKFGEFGDYGVKHLRTADAGSGPYMALAVQPGDSVVLEKFDAYPFTRWQPETPARIRFSIIPEMATIATKLRAGEIDIADWSLPITVQRQIAQNTRYVMKSDAMPTAWFVIMNNARPPLDDPAVRRAVAHAYDANTVTKHILGGGGPLAGPVPASMLGQCDGIATYGFDLEKARAWLAKSKYTPEQLAKFNLNLAAVAGSERFKNIGLSLVTNLKKIGLNAEVKAVRWTDIGQAQTRPETAYDFVVFYDGAKVPDPNVFLVYYTKKGWGDAFPPGGMYYENPKVTEAIEAGVRSSDPAVQSRSYCDAVRMIADDSPSIFSHTDERQVSYWSYLNAFPSSNGALFYDLRFENWRMDTASDSYRQNRR